MSVESENSNVKCELYSCVVVKVVVDDFHIKFSVIPHLLGRLI